MIFYVPYYWLIWRWGALNFRGTCPSVLHKAVFLYLKALPHCLRAGLLVALQEHQGTWDLASVPWFLSFHRNFCLDFTAKLEDSYPGNSDDIWYRLVGSMPKARCSPMGLLHVKCQGREQPSPQSECPFLCQTESQPQPPSAPPTGCLSDVGTSHALTFTNQEDKAASKVTTPASSPPYYYHYCYFFPSQGVFDCAR